MRYKSILKVLIFLFVAIPNTQAGILKSNKEILQDAKNNTLLVSIMADEKVISKGAGVVISKDGFFITNYHVLRPFLNVSKLKLSLKIENIEKKCFESVKLYECQGQNKADICLLKIEGDSFKDHLNFADTHPKKGHTANMIGHCKESFFSSTVILESECFKYNKLYEGLSSKQNKNFDVSVCATNINHCPGDSGGPIFDTINGKLIGIVTEETKLTKDGRPDGEVLKSWKTMIAFDSIRDFFQKYKTKHPTLLDDLKTCGNKDMFPDSEEEKLKWLKQFSE
jgi:hypothetical protein